LVHFTSAILLRAKNKDPLSCLLSQLCIPFVAVAPSTLICIYLMSY